MKHLPFGARRLGTSLAAWCLVLAAAQLAAAQLAAGHAQEHPFAQHPWAKFGVGSWKQVRARNESLNDAGRVVSTSITDTRTTLIGVTDSEYTIRIDVSVEVAGKRFHAT
jgi:hypothetical protein